MCPAAAAAAAAAAGAAAGGGGGGGLYLCRAGRKPSAVSHPTKCLTRSQLFAASLGWKRRPPTLLTQGPIVVHT